MGYIIKDTSPKKVTAYCLRSIYCVTTEQRTPVDRQRKWLCMFPLQYVIGNGSLFLFLSKGDRRNNRIFYTKIEF